MSLTPSEVHNRKFTHYPKSSLREGYDVGEVDTFLDQVEATLVDLHARNDELERQLEVARSSPSGTSAPAGPGPAAQEADPGSSAMKLLQHAQRTADAAVAEAREEAERLLAQAREAVDRQRVELAEARRTSLGELQRERDALLAGVEELRAFEARSRDRLRALLSEQLAELDVRPEVEPLPSSATLAVTGGGDERADPADGSSDGDRPEVGTAPAGGTPVAAAPPAAPGSVFAPGPFGSPPPASPVPSSPDRPPATPQG